MITAFSDNFERLPGLITPADRQHLPVVFFDFDDTLVRTEFLYDVSRSMAKGLVYQLALHELPSHSAEDAQAVSDRFEELERLIDEENAKTMWVFPDRFPTSHIQAYLILQAELKGLAPLSSVDQDYAWLGSSHAAVPGEFLQQISNTTRKRIPMADLDKTTGVHAYADLVFRLREEQASVELPAGAEGAIRDAANYVFRTPAPLIEGVPEVLGRIHRHARIALLTKGAVEVQAKRLRESGLGTMLDSAYLVADKTVDTYLGLIQAERTSAGRSIAVGNSLGSDIKPAAMAGMPGIWIQAHTWEYEIAKSQKALDDLQPEHRALIIRRDDIREILVDLDNMLGTKTQSALEHAYGADDFVRNFPTAVTALLRRVSEGAETLDSGAPTLELPSV